MTRSIVCQESTARPFWCVDAAHVGRSVNPNKSCSVLATAGLSSIHWKPASGKGGVITKPSSYATSRFDLYANTGVAWLGCFEVRSGAVQVTVKAHSAVTRCYDILTDGSIVGTIRPAHPFTRRAFIDCSSSVPELAQLFSFWLAVITWRRESDGSAATST